MSSSANRSLSSSDTSSSSSSSSDGRSQKNVGKSKGGEERRSRPDQFEFKWIKKQKHFCMSNGQWQDYSTPSSKPCKFCNQRYWAF